MNAAGRRIVCTIAHGPHRELLDVTGPALTRYAERHGYEPMIIDRRIAPARPAPWEKIALLHSLAAEPGVVCWVDADALVLDDAPDIELSLAPARFLHLVEHRIRGARVPNAGVMVMRGGPRAVSFFERVWRARDATHHPWWDNAAIIRLLGYRLAPSVRPARLSQWRPGIGFLDKAWNSIPADASPHPNIVHFPGLPVGERLRALEEWSAVPAHA